MRRLIVAGNWKMFGSAERVAQFCAALNGAALKDDLDVLLFPPVGYLSAFVAGLAATLAELGAQDLHVEREGAFTGEIAGPMIHDLGGRWVLAGHSERRSGRGVLDRERGSSGVAAVVLRGVVTGRRGRGAVYAMAGNEYRQDDPGHRLEQGARITLALRPEKLRVAAVAEDGAGANRMDGVVADVAYLGSTLSVSVVTDAAGPLTAELRSWGDARLVEPGRQVCLTWMPDAAVVVDDVERPA